MQKKTPGPDGFKHDFYQAEWIRHFHFYKLFQGIEKEETIFCLFYETCTVLMPKPKLEQGSKIISLT